MPTRPAEKPETGAIQLAACLVPVEMWGGRSRCLSSVARSSASPKLPVRHVEGCGRHAKGFRWEATVTGASVQKLVGALPLPGEKALSADARSCGRLEIDTDVVGRHQDVERGRTRYAHPIGAERNRYGIGIPLPLPDDCQVIVHERT